MGFAERLGNNCPGPRKMELLRAWATPSCRGLATASMTFFAYASKVMDADLRRHDERRRCSPMKRGSVAAAGVLAQPPRSTTSYDTAPIELGP
jgi:hypothetical protein